MKRPSFAEVVVDERLHEKQIRLRIAAGIRHRRELRRECTKHAAGTLLIGMIVREIAFRLVETLNGATGWKFKLKSVR